MSRVVACKTASPKMSVSHAIGKSSNNVTACADRESDEVVSHILCRERERERERERRIRDLPGTR